MKKRINFIHKWNKWKLLFPLLLLFLVFCLPFTVQAASKPAKITSCKLISSKKVQVTATIQNPEKINGKKVYLFAVSISDSKLTKAYTPLRTKTKKNQMSFKVSLNSSKASSLLYSRFVLAEKKANGSYRVISNYRYISNPEKAALHTYRFPISYSKKGLQINANMLEDAMELNISHSALNINLTEVFATKREENNDASVAYKYHEKTYWFRKSYLDFYDRQLTALKETNTTVSAILLVGWRDDQTHLIYPSGRTPGHSYYAWNTASPAAREQLQAVITFLASRYSTTEAKNGRIVNWIVGNEVNNYNVYNYAGNQTQKQYAKIYANAFRLTYNTVTSIYSNARVYISLDHLWNTKVSGAFTARNMLDAFASALKTHGNIPWNLAYHPYSSPLTEPKFWANTNKQLTESISSPVINMGNIDLLTSYIRKKYGSNTRIILSEQGYTSSQLKNGSLLSVEKEQAAAIAYSYYLTESNDMIDSFILNRHVDHQIEMAQGLNLGLWTTDTSNADPEYADTKKASWKVFKYMDTNRSESVTKESLSVIGVKNWKDLISNFRPSLYSKTTIDHSSLKLTPNYQKRASIKSQWKKYGASTKRTKSSGVFRVTQDETKNPNNLWGFTQTFKKAVSFAKYPYFHTTLRVNGATTEKVRVQLRFYSGKHILESYALIPSGQTLPVGVSLANWKYKNSVTKIQVLLAPNGGTWASNASFEMKTPVRGK